MNPNVTAQLRQRQLKMLNIFDSICREHGLHYYLIYGTLIGAVRHKGYIPWDDDIDVGMPIEDYLTFLKIAQEKFPPDLFLQTASTDPYHARFFAKIRMNNTAFVPKQTLTSKKHTGIFIDIFPLYKRNPQQSKAERLRIKLGKYIDSVLIDKRESGKLTRAILFPLYILPAKLLISLRHRLWNTKGDHYFEKDYGHYLPVEDFEPAVLLNFENGTYPAPKNYDKILTTWYGNYMQLPPEDKRITHNPFRISFDLSGPDENLSETE